MNDGSRFTLIGNDGGLLDQPIELDTIELGPAERVDILLDLSAKPSAPTFRYAANAQDGTC